MRYFANPCTPAVREVMVAGLLDCIATPKQGRDRVPAGVRWCADNGCFGSSYPGDDAWWRWLAEHPGLEDCAFGVAPDVVGDAAATLERSLPWLERIRRVGIPAAFVAQDGLELLPVPWDDFDVLFLGGSTEWKLGPHARHLTARAVARGVPVHMGRVSSLKRTLYADAIGCSSVDGTFLRFGPTRRLPEVLGWLRATNDGDALFSLIPDLEGRP